MAAAVSGIPGLKGRRQPCLGKRCEPGRAIYQTQAIYKTVVMCKTTLMKAIGYLRCSTSEQTESGAGLDAQRAAILAEAQRRGWGEIQFIEDAGYGAKDLKRPGIQVALEALRSGRADVLVVSKLDRLSRSLLDFAGLMERATRERWALLALDINVDTGSISGRAVASVMATFAQLERELIGQRTRDALTARRAAGVRLGRPSRLDKATREMIADLRAKGWSLQSIATELARREIAPVAGGRKWYPSTIRRALASLDADARHNATVEALRTKS